jgi:hypothetical protein
MNAKRLPSFYPMLTSWTCLMMAMTALLMVAPADAKESAAVAPGILAGRVLGASEPLASAKVYAYQLADLTLRKVSTDGDGNFFFQELPAGLYKVIAHKPGFVPAVVRLARNSSTLDQFLDLDLVQDPSDRSRGMQGSSAIDFWKVRRDIPRDVLREMGLADPAELSDPSDPAGTRVAALPPLPPMPQASSFADELTATGSQRPLPASLEGVQAEVRALSGISEPIPGQEARFSGGEVQLDTQMGGNRVGLAGSFLSRKAAGDALPLDGHQSTVSLQLASRNDSQLNISSQNNRMEFSTLAGDTSPVDFENYVVRWSQPVGGSGRSEVLARYTEETNFYRGGIFEPSSIPTSSRTLSIAGSYAASIGDQSFQTELRYRERQGDYLSGDVLRPLAFAEETVELVGKGGWQAQPAVLVEYGLYTKLRDGSLSLTPRGGLVWQMNPRWRASAEVTHRIHDEDQALFQDFVPMYQHESSGCDWAEESCYRISLNRESEAGEKLTLGLMQRQFGETLRLYFSEDFFDQLESLVMVEGDRLPEVQMALSRRISPTILATVESNVASGGGGLLFGVGQEPLENRVRYLVTSIDTQFQSTATGVFLAFHHLSQELVPLGAVGGLQGVPQEMQLERLQLMLTQDLNILADLAADWAVHLNMELSRGDTPYTIGSDRDEDALRKSILGGLAVRF